MRFEFKRKSAQLNMRIPQPLLDAVKVKANERGIPYTRYIRELMSGMLLVDGPPARAV